MSKDLGKSTSYAYYVAEGGTKTPQEYGEMLVNIDTVATRAEDAADSAAESATGALNSKNAAQTAATTATNKASEATTAATTATTKAGEASTSASTAASAKDTAVSASQTATSKATEATTAAATATSAATTATTAKDDAVSAKTAAQTAQTGAETAAASVSASAAQIATNTADISDIKENLTTKADLDELYKAFPTDTASGSVASFADGANVPLKSLIVNIDPVQSGSGDPSPDNVRPISGHTQAVVTRTGVNVWDEEWKIGELDANTGAEISGNLLISKNYIPVLGGVSYYWKSPYGGIRCFYDGDKNFISAVYPTANTAFTTPSNARYMKFREPSNYGTTYNHDISINYPSTDHDYHPGTVQSVEVQLGQTVYGGTLDVVSGELVIDRAGVDMGTLNWRTSSTQMLAQDLSPVAESINTSTLPNATCSIYKATKWGSVASTDNSFCVISNQVLVYDSRYTDATAFKTAATGQLLMYKLATPLTVTLDPVSVSALYGSNNVWADTGDSAVEYRADPTLYIGRLTEPDADMVADANIVSGKYFMVGNTLYKATANIASGATISPNVNCTRKSLSEALNELNA